MHRPLTVFLVDDSPLVRERLGALLAKVDGVQIAGSAEDAIAAARGIRRCKPDVVVLDISMPGGNGIALLATIKELKPSPLAVMFTNFPYPQYRDECSRLGADYFFDKTFEFEKIIDTIDHLARQPRG